ncbi:MAG: hypothetical protein M1829_004630 [Trizodia sp. TS-e1964]|nr:MAG: hypothetical protein M1829_004630 [Trizodia sp. TS-e1964]
MKFAFGVATASLAVAVKWPWQQQVSLASHENAIHCPGLPSVDQNSLVEPIRVDLGYEFHEASSNDEKKYYNFSNIPYAEPPTGSLRFAAPQAKKLAGEKKVNNGSIEHICPQVVPRWAEVQPGFVQAYVNPLLNLSQWAFPSEEWKRDVEPPKKDDREDEDCLLLDVIVPHDVYNKKDTPPNGAPVIVWIHGGGFAYGHKALGSPVGLFNASTFNTRPGDGVIFVGINYRLGAYGFLAGQSFRRGGGIPNAGLLDQRLALKWVHDNIAKFGGDPSRVTVMGESAGASSIMHHLTLGGNNIALKPYFDQAILQSPAFVPQGSASQLEDSFQEFLRTANVSNLAELRNLAPEHLELANARMVYNSVYGLFTFGPSVDQFFVPALPGQLLDNKYFHRKVKLMVSYNSDEGLVFTPPFLQNDDDIRKWIRDLYPSVRDETLDYILDIYPAPVPPFNTTRNRIKRVVDLMSDIAIDCNPVYLTDAYAPLLGLGIYKYQFALYPGIHGQDVAYTFYEPPPPPPLPKSPLTFKEEIALVHQQYLTNFAKTGNPNNRSSGLKEFLPYGPLGKMKRYREKYSLGNGKSINENVIDHMNKTTCRWWQEALYL